MTCKRLTALNKCKTIMQVHILEEKGAPVARFEFT